VAEAKSVYEAWTAVMHTVRSIEKSDRNTQQGFTFRGIDATMQAVGPALREHGVMVIPTGTDIASEAYQTKSGTQMRNITVTMQYTVFGPTGDSFTGISYGEAADAGDKAVTKAQSVALRTFLLQSLMVPTGDADPDATTHERAVSRPPTPIEEALAELGDAVAALGLNATDVAGEFYAVHKQTPRGSTPEKVRAFINSLHDNAEVAQ